MINNENYITIQGWMVNKLGLKRNELLVYAIIYGFSQDSNGYFDGSRSYLAKWTNSTERGIQKNLNSLLEKRLIEKEEVYDKGIKYCRYKSVIGGEQSSLGVGNKVLGGRELSSRGWGTKLPKTGEQSSHNIIVDNIEDNIYSAKIKKFKKPTLEEVHSYCVERKNSIDAESFIDYYESKGWLVGKSPMKDWKAAVRTWERSGYNTQTPQWKKITSEPKKERTREELIQIYRERGENDLADWFETHSEEEY